MFLFIGEFKDQKKAISNACSPGGYTLKELGDYFLTQQSVE